jgi:hypothetical protein
MNLQHRPPFNIAHLVANVQESEGVEGLLAFLSRRTRGMRANFMSRSSKVSN